MLKPAKLKKGDKVGIFTPASPVKEPFRSNGLEKIKELGYIPVEVDDILSKHDFLAKKTADSLQDIRDFFMDRNIKALWAARGGYGSNLLLPLLSGLQLPEPKIIIGSSDISYLLWFLLDHYQTVVFYGPMAYSSLPEDRFDAENFTGIVSGNYDEMKIPAQILVPGNVSAIVTGGCLSNFVSLIGTPYLPITEDRVLLLEDVGERPYRLDRMFWQIEEAGILAGLKGLLLGDFPGCFKDAAEKEHFLERVRSYAAKYNFPVLYDLPFGHSQNIHTLPLGIEIHIDTTNFQGLTFTEKGVGGN